MSIIIIYPHNTSKNPDIYYFRRTQKNLFVIIIYWTFSDVNLILHLIHFVMQPLLHMKFIYPLLGRKYVSIYWIMMPLPSHIFLMQLQTYQPVINFWHRIRRIFGSYLLMKKYPFQKKGYLINWSSIRLNIENTRSRSSYVEGLHN